MQQMRQVQWQPMASFIQTVPPSCTETDSTADLDSGIRFRTGIGPQMLCDRDFCPMEDDEHVGREREREA